MRKRWIVLRKKKLTLVVRDLMARLVDTGEAEVAVLTDLTVFSTVNHHGLVACTGEFFGMRIVNSETDSFSTEPIA